MSHDASSLVDAVLLLKGSKKFQQWHPLIPKRSMLAEETYFTPQELADMWKVSVQTIRQVFENEEGVLKIGRDGTRTRRRYKTLRIPESVVERVHARLSA